MEENEKIVLVDPASEEVNVDVVARLNINDNNYLIYQKENEQVEDEESNLYIVKINENDEIEEIDSDEEYKLVLSQIDKYINSLDEGEEI